MNRYRFAALMLIIAMAVTAPMSCKKAASEGQLTLSGFLGEVMLKTTDGERVPAVGDILAVGTTLVTGEMGMADIMLGDRGIIRIHQNSTVLIDSIDKKGIGDTELDMAKGKMYVTLSKLSKGGLKVMTPTAVASIRGTVFRISAEEGVSRLDVVSGQVAINPVSESTAIAGVERIVDAEQSVSIDRNIVAEARKAVDKKEAMVIEVEQLKIEEIEEITSELRNIKPEIIEKLNPRARKDVRRKLSAMHGGNDRKEASERASGRKEIKKTKKAESDALRRKALLEARRQKQAEVEKRRLEKELADRQMKEMAEKARKKKEVRERASSIPTL